MERKYKIAAAAAIAATAIIAFSAGHRAANTAEAEAARTEARTGDLVRSASLCQEAGGHWYTTANGAPRCDTNATVRTRLVSGSESCAGRKRKEANNITVCDEAK